MQGMVKQITQHVQECLIIFEELVVLSYPLEFPRYIPKFNN